MILTSLSVLFLYPVFWFLQLSQRRKEIIVLRNVRVKHPAIVLCHIQGAVSHQLLERERIPSAIDEILAGEGMPEFVDGRAGDAA